MTRKFVTGLAVLAWLAAIAGGGEPRLPRRAPRAYAAGATRPLAFPGALGWAAHTPGGRGGQIIKVTNLNGDGPGSLRAAVEAKGPRIVVFEVGGVIDLGQREIKITEPYLTIAGQTAPSPGITLIRGGIDLGGHDVVIQHIRVRVGEAGAQKKSGWEEDAFSTIGDAHDIIVDHCSFYWATDENMSASGQPLRRRHAGKLARAHLAPRHLLQQHRGGRPRLCDALQDRALQGLADPRQHVEHPDLRQSLRA